MLIIYKFKLMKSISLIYQQPLSEYDIHELDYNQEETKKCQNLPVYLRYKKWLKDNGVLVDSRIRYPTYFGSAKAGVVGISASKPIEKNRAVIAIPYDLFITVEKVRKHEELAKIIKDNPQIFKDEEDSHIKILVLFVSYELIKGQKSFYFPYLQISTGQLLSGWETWTLYKLQNREVAASIKAHKQQQQRQYVKFLSVYRRYDSIFPQQKSNQEYKDIFQRSHSFISSRAFGWSIPSLSLIPMADSLNHGNYRFLDHFLVNIEKEKQGESKQEKGAYVRYRNKTNLSLLKDEYFNLSQEELSILRNQAKPKAVKFIEKHKHILDESLKVRNIEPKKINFKNKSEVRNTQFHILHQQYKAGIHKLKNLHFYESSCTEDNDTDQETIFQVQSQKERQTFHDLSRQITEKNKKIEVKRYWKQFYEDDSEDSEDSEELEKSKKQQTITKELREKLFAADQSTPVSSNQSDEEDEDYQWTQTLKNHAKSYFVMSSKEIIKQKEQIFNFYGRRTNKFLISGYNFVLEDNIYDSFGLRLKFQDSLSSKVSASSIVFVDRKRQKAKISKQIRLKKFRINIDLINICRSYILLWSKKEYENCRIEVPFDRQIELQVLKMYEDIIQHCLKEYTTSLEEDEEMELQGLKYEERTAIALRKQYKKIMRSQENLIRKCIKFVKKWKVNAIQDIDESEMCWIKRIRPYLIKLEMATSL